VFGRPGQHWTAERELGRGTRRGGTGADCRPGGAGRNAGNRRLTGGAFNRPAPDRNRRCGNSRICAVIGDSRYGRPGTGRGQVETSRGMPHSRRPGILANATRPGRFAILTGRRESALRARPD